MFNVLDSYTPSFGISTLTDHLEAIFDATNVCLGFIHFLFPLLINFLLPNNVWSEVTYLIADFEEKFEK